MNWNFMSLYWLLWLALGFGIPEGIALGTGHPEWTLSDQVWHLEGHGATFWRWTIACFTIWLVLHMVFRLFK